MQMQHDEELSHQEVELEENEVQQRPHQKGEKVIQDVQGKVIDPIENCNIYVAGIPRRTTEDNLRKIFS